MIKVLLLIGIICFLCMVGVSRNIENDCMMEFADEEWMKIQAEREERADTYDYLWMSLIPGINVLITICMIIGADDIRANDMREYRCIVGRKTKADEIYENWVNSLKKKESKHGKSEISKYGTD